MDYMNFAFACDEKYVRYAYVMLTSLFENHKNDALRVFFLFNNISDEKLKLFEELEEKYKQLIVGIHIGSDFFPEDLPHTKEWPLETYFRLALADVLPKDVDRVLYLDTDIIVDKNIKDFYFTDMKGKSICACPDMSVTDGLFGVQAKTFGDYIKNGDFTYFNAGVIIFDLDRIRKSQKYLCHYLGLLDVIELVALDQDMLNYEYYNDVLLEENEKYNFFAKHSYNLGKRYEWCKEKVSIIHFAGRKPWQFEGLRYDTEIIWWEYAAKTPFYKELLEELIFGEMRSGYVDTLVRDMSREKNELMQALDKCLNVIKRLEQT